MITISEVDARCGEKCAGLAAAIVGQERATLRELVDEALLAAVPSPTPSPAVVTAEDVTAYLAEHASDFSGPPERDRAAVRFFLERERRRELATRLVAAAAERSELHVARHAGMLANTDDAVLALVGDRTIDARAVAERAAVPLYRLRGELARERLRQLDELLRERLWADAARERGTAADVMRAEVTSTLPPVSDTELDRYLESTGVSRDGLTAESRTRARPYLEFRARRAAEDAFLVDQRRERRVTVLLAEPEPPQVALDPAPGASLGPSEGKRRILLLTSYRGEESRRTWALVRDFAQETGIGLAVRPLLPQWDPEATVVAAAVRCATEQGRFGEMQDAVASASPLPDQQTITAIARRLGLDERALATCMTSASTLDEISVASAAAERLGLREPPTVLLDGRVLGRSPSRERLEEALAATRATPGSRVGATPVVSAPSSSASASP